MKKLMTCLIGCTLFSCQINNLSVPIIEIDEEVKSMSKEQVLNYLTGGDKRIWKPLLKCEVFDDDRLIFSKDLMRCVSYAGKNIGPDDFNKDSTACGANHDCREPDCFVEKKFEIFGKNKIRFIPINQPYLKHDLHIYKLNDSVLQMGNIKYAVTDSIKSK